jgi:integrase
MSVYKRPDSEYYWFKFSYKGTFYQRSAKVKNKREAETIEAAFRTLLANGSVGLEDPTPAPTLREFSQQFIDFVETRHADKPATVRFYAHRLKVLLKSESLRNAKLDRIDEAMIARYVGQRRKSVGIVSVNREMATLRRILHIAHEWKVIKVVPKVRLLPGEPGRDFILDHTTERDYLAACPPLLHDVAVVLLDTGLRLGEALALQWSAVHLEPVGRARYGYVQVNSGKSKNARRTVPLTARASGVLTERQRSSKSTWVFPGDTPDSPLLGTSLAHMHSKVCRPGKGDDRRYVFPARFVLHSCRHTALTRLGEAGADAFTIMKLAGHSSVTISQRYVHPTGETVELAFDRLEALNRKALEGTGGEK